MTHALFDLAANPEYLNPLREEVEEVTKRKGWSKSAVDQMHKLDSFLKESQRFNPAGISELFWTNHDLRTILTLFLKCWWPDTFLRIIPFRMGPLFLPELSSVFQPPVYTLILPSTKIPRSSTGFGLLKWKNARLLTAIQIKITILSPSIRSSSRSVRADMRVLVDSSPLPRSSCCSHTLWSLTTWSWKMGAAVPPISFVWMPIPRIRAGRFTLGNDNNLFGI